MRRRVGEHGSNYPSDISRGDWRGFAPSEWELDAASVADGRSDEAKEETLQEDGWPDSHDRQAGPCERLLAEPVLALLRARGGVLNAHLGDGHLGHVNQGGHPDLPGDRRHDHGCLQIPSGNRHAEVDSQAAFNDPLDVGRFEQVSGHHLGASGSQGCRSFVLAVNHGADRKPAIEEQPGDEDGSNISHATFLPFAELLASKRPGSEPPRLCAPRAPRTEGDVGPGRGALCRDAVAPERWTLSLFEKYGLPRLGYLPQ